MMNILNGGAHADNNVDLQEFMMVPVGRRDFREALRMGAEIFHALEGCAREGPEHLRRRRGRIRAQPAQSEAAIELILEAIRRAGYKPGEDVAACLDCAASEFYKDGRYILEAENRRSRSGEMDRYSTEPGPTSTRSLASRTVGENDWEGWKPFTDGLGKKVQLVGDDLFVTNTEFSSGGHRQGRRQCDPDQGQPDRHADGDPRRHRDGQARGYTAVISHRSGETEDSTIADLAVATNAGQIKTGSLSRSDRIAKYNQLLRIEEQLGDQATYPGPLGLL